MDHGHDLLFGSFVTPSAAAIPQVVALAELADQVGLDLFTLQDHPYQASFGDTWTLLSVIGARTSRIRLSPNVINLPLRQPAVLAKSAATLDLVTGGRVELGLGAGAFGDAAVAMGAPRLTPREGIDALAEAIAVIRAMWDPSGRTVRVEGRHHRVVGTHPGPAPAHDIGIWIGAAKPRMLALTGRLADGWLPSSMWAPPEAIAGLAERIDDAAVDAGRSPGDIRRLYNVVGRFGTGAGFLEGPPAAWAEQLAGLALDEGMSAFILASDEPDAIRRYAAEVAPAVRELVAAEREGRALAPEVEQAMTVVSQSGSSAPPAQVPTTGAAVPGLGYGPTPPPAVWLSGRRPWDEDARPTGPAPEAGRTYTEHEKVSGHHLIDVHDHLRQELEQLRDLVSQVAAGRLAPGDARSHIAQMTLRQNAWTLGTYCSQYCRVVTTHHTLEDQGMFPHLRRQPGLAPVVDRLAEEHVVIHDLLERVDRALVEMVEADQGDPSPLQDALDLMTDALLSHLAYEERELIEPIARAGFS